MQRSTITVGLIPGIKLSLYFLFIYLPDIKATLEVACNITDTCTGINETCLNGICACADGFYDSNGADSRGVCYPKVDLGYTCTSVSGEQVCKDPNAVCNGKCVCDPNYYDNNTATTAGGTCQPTTILRVTNITYGAITENSITVSWTPPSHKMDVSYYRVELRTVDTLVVISNQNVGNQTSFSFINLDPGRKYSIVIFSVNTQTDLTERFTSVTQNQTTMPAIPGALVMDRDIDASSGSITLQWTGSSGIATGYGGSLTNNTALFVYYQAFNTSGISTSQTFSGVRSGTWYTFTVQAVIGYVDTKTLYSDIRTRLIRTRSQVPNPPTNLSCGNSTDSEIRLKWIQPQLPNGDIISYVIVIERTQPSQKPYNVTSQGTNVEYTAVGLTEGSFYTFKVYTRNELNTSTLYAQVENCKTKPKMAEPPVGLNITNETSRSGHVTWNRPNNLNGTLYGYSLQILNGSYWCREVIWRCSDCQGGFPLLTNLCPANIFQKNASSLDLQGQQSYVAIDLLPDTSYAVKVVAITVNGTGYPATDNLVSKEEAPSKPSILSVKNTNSTGKTAVVEWSIDGPRPGQTKYIIVATGISPAEKRTFTVSGFFSRTYEFFNLEEYWTYILTVQANTSIGSNQSDPINFTTLAGPAGYVNNFNIDKGTGDDMYVKARVSWTLPDVLNQNGPISSFYVEQRHNYGNGTQIELNKTNIARHPDDTYTYSFTFDVQPEVNYTFMVRADTGNLKGEEIVKEYSAPAGPPVNIESTGVDVITANKSLAYPKTSFRVEILKDFFTNTKNGAIQDYGLICCKDPTCKEDRSVVQSFNDAIENMMTYTQAKMSGSNKYRLPNKITSVEQVSLIRKRAVDNIYVYDVGIESCDGLSIDQYCNGKLDPGSTYRIIAFVCTRSWCTLSKSYGPFITLSDDTVAGSMDTPVIVGIVCGTFSFTVLSIAITIIIVRKTRTKQRSADASPGDTYMDLTTRTNDTPYMSYKSPVYDSIPAEG